MLAVEDIDPIQVQIVDGTLLKTWDWKGTPGLFAGKYRTAVRNVQVARARFGALARVSDPLPGSAHDAAALGTSGLLDVPPECLPGGQAPPTLTGDGAPPGWA
ncbi:hypothetical protein [Actinomyces sp. 565]|uniref:hypothetical protein n=1 Tax=Actinomyces sp. 565 TaxID=2057794 RepID=UPI00193A3C41|nr:hypothetical protein [Actinomyces sp. 565]